MRKRCTFLLREVRCIGAIFPRVHRGKGYSLSSAGLVLPSTSGHGHINIFKLILSFCRGSKRAEASLARVTKRKNLLVPY